MVKKIISYIFIYIVLVGCESPLVCEDCYLDIKAPNLTLDNNGYYHMEFLEILIAGHWTNLVNGSSYTDDDGKAYTVLGVWENFTGDTIKVYSGYTDNCNIQHVDSLEVVIE